MLKKTLNIILFVLIVIAGIFSFAEMYAMFNVKSQEIGQPVTSATKEELTEVAKYDVGFVEFEKVADNNYVAIYTYSATEFDGTKNNYELFFNDIKLQSKQTAGTISSTLKKTFYNTDNEVSAIVNINIEIKFTITATMLTFQSNSSGDSLSYFTTYMNIYGATIMVAKGV